MSQDAKKRRVAEAAFEKVRHLIDSETPIGIGTGSTANCFIDVLAESKIQVLGAVASSEATAERLAYYGIALLDLNATGTLPVYVDGADEADTNLNLIKGGGAALLREKIVAQQSAAMVVVADDRKQVDCLGAFGIPIEITPFACDVTVSALASMLNCNVELRMDGDAHVLTDNGNCIADARIGPTINDPIATEANILNVAGVVQVGLFNNMCDAVVLASGDGVQTLMNPKGRL